MNNSILLIVCFISSTILLSCKSKQQHSNLQIIHKSTSDILINGSSADEAWSKTDWHELDHNWLGPAISENDFSGRFKILWSEEQLFLLAETTDDIIMDQHADGLDRYWDDDCLELFIDENNSDGNHQYNHNAFAYHVSTGLRVTDIGPDSIPAYFDHHLQSAMSINESTITWEIAINVYTDDYKFGSKPRKLTMGEELGFMLAYCDNDRSAERENFIGSIAIEGEDKNRGWIDAGVFNNWVLGK